MSKQRLTARCIQIAAKPTAPPGSPCAIHDYQSLASKAAKFANGDYDFIIICGEGGIGKTEAFLRAMGEQRYGFIGANASDSASYEYCYEHIDEPIIIDDSMELLRSERGRSFLKQLTDTTPGGRKRITMQTNRTSKKNGPPSQFWTRSKVALLTNEFKLNGNAHWQAVKDRALYYVFEPSPIEIHRYVATWFWNQAVFDYIASLLPYLAHALTCRLYVKAAHLCRAGDKWQDEIKQATAGHDDIHFAVAQLQKEFPGPDRLQNRRRWEAFVNRGHGSRATYFRYHDRLTQDDLQEVEYIKVQGTDPALLPAPMPGMIRLADYDQGDEE